MEGFDKPFTAIFVFCLFLSSSLFISSGVTPAISTKEICGQPTKVVTSMISTFQNNTLQILFEGAYGTITINSPSIDEKINDNATYSFPKNTTVILTASGGPGTGLIYWYGCQYSTLDTISIQLDSDKTITAYFEHVNGPTMSYLPPDFLEPGDLLMYQMDPGGDPCETQQLKEYLFNKIEYALCGYGDYYFWALPGYEHANMYIGNCSYYDEHGNLTHVEHGVIDTGRPTVIHEYGDYLNNSMVSHVDGFRVCTANESQKQAAIDWYMDKLYTPYQSFFYWFGGPLYPDISSDLGGEIIGGCRKSHIYDVNGTDPHSGVHPDRAKFYCHEILWASYYHQGIDIDKNEWDTGWEYFPHLKIPDLKYENNKWKRVWNETCFVVAAEIVSDDDVISLCHVDDQGNPIGPMIGKPTGPDRIKQYSPRLFSVIAPDEDVYIQWDWGHFIGPWTYSKRSAYSTLTRIHSWPKPGSYQVRVRAKNETGITGPWSESITVNVTPPLFWISIENDTIHIHIKSVTIPLSIKRTNLCMNKEVCNQINKIFFTI